MKIIGCIFLLIFLLLLLPVRLYVNSEPELTVVVKYLWFKKGILPKGEKPAQKAPEKKKSTKKIKEKRALSYTLQELLELMRILLRRTTPPVRRLLRRTSLAKLRLRMIVAGEDAAKTAIKFGKVNAQVFSAVALIKQVIRLNAEEIEILPGFGVAKGETSYSGELRLIPLAMLAAGVQIAFWGLASALPVFLRSRKKNASGQSGGEAPAARKGDQNGKETPVKRGA